MFGSLGFTELILILFIVLIIFGAGKLPQLGEGVGKAIRGFKKSVHEAEAVETEMHNVDGQPNQSPGSPQSSDAAPASDSGQHALHTAPTVQNDREGFVASSSTPVPQSESGQSSKT